jgi:hypothetical protein
MFPPPAQQKQSGIGAALKGIVGTLLVAGLLGVGLLVGLIWYFRKPAPTVEVKPTVVTEVKKEAPPAAAKKQDPPQPKPGPTLPPRRNTVLQARLLTDLGTQRSQPGDLFAAQVGGGAYAGAVVRGHLTEVDRKNKEKRMGFQFETIEYHGTRYPIRAELRAITNKDVEEDNTAVNTAPSKKRVAILGAVGGAVGGVIGRIKGGSKTTTAVGAAAGTGAGVVVAMTVAKRAGDLNFPAGTPLTIAISN